MKHRDGRGLRTQLMISSGFTVSGGAATSILALVLGSLTPSAAAAMQVAPPPTTPAVVDENAGEPEQDQRDIIVTGTRAVLDSSVSAKRRADSVADFISIGDTGDLPTTSIADSLEFIPGATGARFRGTVDNLSLRGLPALFTFSTVDGRELSSGDGNRYVRYRIYPDEFFTQAGVYKSTTPDQVEGAIAGLIDLSTPSPLNNKPSLRMSARLQHSPYNRINQFVDQAGYRLNFAGSQRFDVGGGELGAMFGFNLLDNPVAYASAALPLYSRATLAGQQVVLPQNAVFQNAAENFRRVAAHGAIEWESGAGLRIKLNGLYTTAESREDRSALLVNQLNLPARYVNPVIAGGALQSANLSAVPVVIRKETVARDDDAMLLGGNIRHDFDNWRLELDAYLSRTDVLQDVRRPAFVSSTMNATIDLTGRDVILGNFSRELTDPAIYAGQSYFGGRDDRRDQAYGFRFDAARSFEGGVLQEAKAGLRYANRSLDSLRQTENVANLGNAAAFPQFARGRLSGGLFLADPTIAFDLRSSTPGAFPSAFALFDTAALLAALPTLTFPPNNADLLQGFVGNSEKSWAGFVSTKGEFALGQIPVQFTAGTRLVRTQLTAQGFSGVPIANTDPVTGEVTITVGNTLEPVTERSSYTKLLPSLNLRFDWTPTLQSRLSASRAIARPNFFDQRVAQTLNGGPASNQFFTGAAGNPRLRPIISDQVDATLEWYPSRSTALTANVYYKSVKDFVVDAVRTIDVGGYDFQVSSPVNADQGDFYGIEVTARLDFDFLPTPLDGLGLIANFTRNWTSIDPGYGLLNDVDASGEFLFDVADREPGVEGFAPMTGSAILFYEKGPLTLRGSARYASDRVRFASSLNAPRVSRERTLFDASATVRINPKMSLQAQVLNITEQSDDAYYVFDNYTALGEQYGRTFYFGLDVRF